VAANQGSSQPESHRIFVAFRVNVEQRSWRWEML